jgi:hypothetical protein
VVAREKTEKIYKKGKKKKYVNRPKPMIPCGW